MPFIDPNQITVTSRQRTTLDTSELEESIERLGQLQPIVCRQINGSLYLVAGGRRLQACKNLNRQIEYILLNTLDDFSSKCAELEENIKRDDLPWQDRAPAINDIHELYRSHNESWSMENTAAKLGVTVMTVFRHIKVVKFAIKNPEIFKLSSLDQALTSVDRATDRLLAQHVEEISHTARQAFKGKPQNGVTEDPAISNISNSPPELDSESPIANPIIPITNTIVDSSPNKVPDSIICASFLDWAPTYDGPKFNFIHCDFPYGVNIGGSHGLWERGENGGTPYENNPKIFFNLTDCLVANFDRLASYSCNLMFWFAAKWYSETLNKLQSIGLEVIVPPMIWYHSDNRGMTPWVKGIMQPKRVYDMAFIASRGDRSLLKHEVPNLYGAPLVSHPIHPTQKPESMLSHFFSMLVDSTTTMLDPTCGSASALSAAEALGAKTILGIEYNPEYAKAANSRLNQQRTLRRLSKEIKET